MDPPAVAVDPPETSFINRQSPPRRLGRTSRLVLWTFPFLVGSVFLTVIKLLGSIGNAVQEHNFGFEIPEHFDTEPADDDTSNLIRGSSSMDHFINITTPQPLPTLVHYDARFLGGYRNQHMRFVAFVNFAVQNAIPQILLPSLRWGVAQGAENGNDAPFEYLFDVAYWNEGAEREGLPRLVRYDASVLEGFGHTANTTNATRVACFNISSNLYSGLDEHLLRNPNTNLRRVKIWDEIGNLEGYSHCRQSLVEQRQQQQQQQLSGDGGGKFTYLIPHGGLKGVGKLWSDYNAMQRQRGKANTTINNQTLHPEHHPVERSINKILRPSVAIRNAIQSSMNSHADVQNGETSPKILALHPRIEHDMLQHRCSKYMEQNLTKIFGHLRGDISRDVDLFFLAVNVELIFSQPQMNLQSSLRELAVENAMVLNRTRAFGLFGNEDSAGIPMFESGFHTAETILFPAEQPMDYSNMEETQRFVTAKSLGISSLVASIVDFFTIVDSDKFVGVKGSSFSTDLFSVRYYMGKRDNYILSPEGVKELVGPPPAHSCN